MKNYKIYYMIIKIRIIIQQLNQGIVELGNEIVTKIMN